MITQKLYVDYAGGMFVTWFYSDGQRYKGTTTHNYEDVLRYKRKNDFTDIILTDTAKQFNRR